MQLLRIHYQKLFLCVSFVMLVLVFVRVWEAGDEPRGLRQTLQGSLKGQDKRGSGAKENSINIDSPVLSPIRHNGHESIKTNVFADLFQDLTKEETCPLCFGHDLCEDVSAGFLTLATDSPQVVSGAAMYSAHLGDMQKLSVKIPTGSSFSLLDESVCVNASLGSGCSVGSAAPKSFLARAQPLSLQLLHHLLKIVGTSRNQYPLLMCPSKKLLGIMEQSFDDNDDRSLSQDERIMLYTTLAIAPDIVILKILTKANLNVGFPRLVGVCGRAGVLEGELTPLASMLDESFNVRASLAAQILTMVDDFMEDDPEWYLFYGSWSLDRMAINKEGEVVLTDLAGMAIVDKNLFRDEYEDGTESRTQEVCNRECFQKFTSEVYREGHDTDEICSRVEDVGHLMYAAVCAMILSDMKQHKYVDYFTSSASQQQQPRTTKGLLHNIPASDRATVEELVAECVDETAPGGRLQAAQELRDFLSDFLLDEEDDDKDDDGEELDGKDEDEDDYDDDYDYGEEEGSGGFKNYWRSRTLQEQVLLVLSVLEAIMLLGFVIGVACLSNEIISKDEEIRCLTVALEECEAGTTEPSSTSEPSTSTSLPSTDMVTSSSTSTFLNSTSIPPTESTPDPTNITISSPLSSDASSTISSTISSTVTDFSTESSNDSTTTITTSDTTDLSSTYETSMISSSDATPTTNATRL